MHDYAKEHRINGEVKSIMLESRVTTPFGKDYDFICTCIHRYIHKGGCNSQEVGPLVICLPGPKPYASQKAIPYKYECTILEDDKDMPLNPLIPVSNIADSSQVLRSGRILPAMVQIKASAPVKEPMLERNLGKGKAVGQPSGITYEDSDEVLKLIKRSEYKVVDQLLQTPAKISIMSLLTNSDAHR